MKILSFLLLFGLVSAMGQESRGPVRIAIVGLNHDHANGFLPRALKSQELQIVGIVEPDRELALRYAKRFNLETNLFYPNLKGFLEKNKVDAVATFTSTFAHREVVETCAPRGIHVMMEKPLAVNMEHARAIQAAAKKGNIEVLVNYETTWYPANQAAYGFVHEQNAVGELRKIVVHDGHRGPKEIGCSTNFLAWLTDPVLNGAGALTDFGCYGADLITWLMDGERPTSVFAVTQHIKPDVYPKVEDEATIVVTYPKAQGIIQASWNWPFDRKDMEIYGRTGYAFVPRRDVMRTRKAGGEESEQKVAAPAGPMVDEISYLGAVVRREIKPSGLSSLQVNMIVTEILDAARESARTGKKVQLK